MPTTVSPTGAVLTAQFHQRMVDLRIAAKVGGTFALGAAGVLIKNETKRIISQPYPPASVPNEPPHQRRGEDGGLLASYDSWLESDDTVVIGSGGTDPEGQAAFLEMGTSKMKPRPHLRPAVANMLQGGNGGQIGEVFLREVARNIRRAAS